MPCAAEADGGPLHPDTAREKGQTLRLTGQVLALTGHLLPTPTTSEANGPGVHGRGGADLRTAIHLLTNNVAPQPMQWGKYGAAITHWEEVLDRNAPSPILPTGRNGKMQLSALFVEWMMGLPTGWVTDINIGRKGQLKALGNGVVPQQAAHALRDMKSVFDKENNE